MRTVVVTGGSRGIGAACVRRFSSEKIFFLYKNSVDAATALSNETGAVAIRADVSDSFAVRNAFEQIGPVDVLINNAGISSFSLLQDETDEQWRRMIDTNLSGAFYCSRAVLPSMIQHGNGVILNVSSSWGQVGASCEVSYSAAKSGLIGLTKALAKEVGPSGIRVNCLCPGVVATEMNNRLSSEEASALKEDIPLGRFSSAEEIADWLHFLASDIASYMTGQVIGVNGGFVIN